MSETAGALERAVCTRCGTFFANDRDVFYTEEGNKVCGKCFELADLDVAAKRYAKTVRNGGYAAPLVALGAMVAAAFLGIIGILLVGAAMLTSGGTLVALARDEELRGRLGAHLVPVILCLVLATVMTGGCLALLLLGFGAMLLR
jgi:hypothetical protein